MMKMNKRQAQSGFTLVELAIVLVIIGLIVGGVLVGQDLIKAAQIRAVSSDLGRFDVGANAFRTKYGGLPGDLLATSAQNYGLCASTGTDGNGDGDGVLENLTTNKTGLGGENLLFWYHLSQAQMIPYGFPGPTTGFPVAACSPSTALTALSTAAAGTPSLTTLQLVMPQLRIRATGFIHAYGVSGINYYAIGNFVPATGALGDANGMLRPAAALSPREAQGIDAKVDDGFPDRGIMISIATATDLATATTAANSTAGASTSTCYNSSSSPPSYQLASEDAANNVNCVVRIRAGF